MYDVKIYKAGRNTVINFKPASQRGKKTQKHKKCAKIGLQFNKAK